MFFDNGFIIYKMWGDALKKRILSLVAAMIMLSVFCFGSFSASASIYYLDGQAVHCPGNTRVYTPLSNYNYAWIDYVVLRDSSTSVSSLELRPVTDNPYSHTYSEFVKECSDYTSLFYVSEDVLEDTFTDSLKSVYYSLLATGLVKNDYQTMRAYNESMGIVYPYAESSLTEMYTAITYVCLRADLYKLLTDKEIYIPRGTTVEGAVVAYLSTVCGVDVPANVSTVSGFSYIFARDYVLEDENFPVSEDPSEEEVFFWTKVKAADACGYSVPKTTPYSEITQSQAEYVTYAYYASILTTKYGVMVDPYQLKDALSKGGNAVPVLVLKSMLDHVSIGYSNSESGKELFEKAKQEGFFDLENQFYTDIYDYELTVAENNDKVWITSFLLANQLENGSLNNVQTFVNSKLVANSATTAIELNSKSDTVFSVKIIYSDGSHQDSAVYTFTVKKGASSITEHGTESIDIASPLSGVTGELEGIASKYVFPEINVSAYKEALNNHSTESNHGNTLSTYSVTDQANTTAYNSSANRFTTYSSDETASAIGNFNLHKNEEQTTQTLLSGVVAVVKENPAAVATPFGLLAIGASAGYVFFKKRKEDAYASEDEDDITDIDDISID